MSKNTRLSDFDRATLDALEQCLAQRVQVGPIDYTQLHKEEYRNEVTYRLGRHSVLQDVLNAMKEQERNVRKNTQ